MAKEVLPPDVDHNGNLDDYDKARAAFDWKQVEPEFDWFRTGRVNMAHEAIDRHCRGPRKNKLALLYTDGQRVEKHTFEDLMRLSNRFGNALVRMGVKRGDRVFVYLPRVPVTYIGILGVPDGVLNTVHGIAVSNDGFVYVGDRVNNRIQSFRLDGTFVNEVFIERKTSARFGTGFGAAFSQDKAQRFFFVPDGTNKKVQIVDRASMQVIGFFGGVGGHGVGEFSHIHSIATDSKGNIYLGEVDTGRRAYRWNYKGLSGR